LTVDSIQATFNLSNFDNFIKIENPIILAPYSTEKVMFTLPNTSDMTERVLVIEAVHIRVGSVCFELDRNLLPAESPEHLPMTSFFSKQALHVSPLDKVRSVPQSCKIRPPQAKAELIIGDPGVIHIGETIKINIKYKINEPGNVENIKIILQTNKESIIEKTKEDLVMKDPCQHLSFENNENNKIGEISFWVRHVSPTGQPETLVVANLHFSLSAGDAKHSIIKRAELKLPLVKPLQVFSKCSTELLRPMLATPPLDKCILSLIKVESITKVPIVIESIEFIQTEYLTSKDTIINMKNIQLTKQDSCQGISFKSSLV
jgi:hypothetical protein